MLLLKIWRYLHCNLHPPTAKPLTAVDISLVFRILLLTPVYLTGRQLRQQSRRLTSWPVQLSSLLARQLQDHKSFGPRMLFSRFPRYLWTVPIRLICLTLASNLICLNRLLRPRSRQTLISTRDMGGNFHRNCTLV